MTDTDWLGRARREAAAILAEVNPGASGSRDYDTLVSLMAVAWLQGTIFGSHETLNEAEDAFGRVREAYAVVASAYREQT